MTPPTIREALENLVGAIERLDVQRGYKSPVYQEELSEARAALAREPVGIGVKEAALLHDAINDDSLSDAVFRVVVTDLVRGFDKPTKGDIEWAREQLSKQASPSRVLVEKEQL